MKIHQQMSHISTKKKGLILTIGFFDGVHLGHVHVLNTIQNLAGPESCKCIITFKNHPSEILRPNQITPLLCTLEHKLNLLRSFSIDHLFLLDFSNKLANQTAENFIYDILQYIPFTHLVLGHDATLGKNREGTKENMLMLAKKHGFELVYLPEYRLENQPISSTRIRKIIQEGKLKEAEVLLGRPYSIYGEVVSGIGKGSSIGFPTANINVDKLCLPPRGVYSVKVIFKNKTLQGIANLGIAPTIKNALTPTLEVHLPSWSGDLYGQFIEVIFEKFIRPEKKFSSVEELKIQIKNDIDGLTVTPVPG